jgi:gas vesicle protein
MRCVSIDIDKGVPLEDLPPKVCLKGEKITQPLLEEAKNNWHKIELAYHTAYYGQTLYKKSAFDGVLYVDHDERLAAEQEYVRKLRKEKNRIKRSLSNFRPKFYKSKEELEKRIEDLSGQLEYHDLEYEIYEASEHDFIIAKRKKVAGHTYYRFKFQLHEREIPDFSRYEICLLKGWQRDLGTLLKEYDTLQPEKKLSDFIAQKSL